MYHDVSWSTVGWIDWIYHNLYDDVQIYIYTPYTVYIISIYIYICIYNMYVLLRTDISWYVYSYNMDKSTNTDLAMAHHGAFLTASAVPATFTSGWIETGFVPLENRGKYWKSLETMRKILEITGNYGKIWEIHWKIWENMGNSLENLGKYGTFIGKSGKIWETLRRSWEDHAKLMGKSSRNLLMYCSWLLKLSVFSR